MIVWSAKMVSCHTKSLCESIANLVLLCFGQHFFHNIQVSIKRQNWFLISFFTIPTIRLILHKLVRNRAICDFSGCTYRTYDFVYGPVWRTIKAARIVKISADIIVTAFVTHTTGHDFYRRGSLVISHNHNKRIVFCKIRCILLY